MSGWSLKEEAFQLQTPYLASPAVTHLLSPTFPATFVLASLPGEGGQWLISQHPGLFPPSPHGTGPKTVAPRATSPFPALTVEFIADCDPPCSF